jgi:N-acetylmuramoyl-L-alanine amidase
MLTTWLAALLLLTAQPVDVALVEHLFLSNPDEAALLRDEATLDALADGDAQGILEYLAGVGD